MRKVNQLNILKEQVTKCEICPLLQGRTQTVFGHGNPDAHLMIVGEAPGRDEDLAGVPFVGKAGQLLNNIIKACGWTREELYIANILCCRPPNNRNPSSEEAANCRPFLLSQIELVQPKIILCLGRIASYYLCGDEKPFEELTMAHFRRIKIKEWNGMKVFFTYHPSFLLRNPSAKEEVWLDLQPVIKELRRVTSNE